MIDKSGAMQEGLTSKSASKAEAAYKELEDVLTRLDGRLVFNVWTYNENVEAYARKPAKLGSKSRKGALSFVRKANEVGQKDIWQVLEAVIADPTLDTAYLLSSGEPDVGLYVHWNRVTDHLRDINRFHKVVVHTVAYSDNSVVSGADGEDLGGHGRAVPVVRVAPPRRNSSGSPLHPSPLMLVNPGRGKREE